MAIAGVIDASTPGGMHEDSAGAIIVGLGMIAVFGLVIVGGGIGVGGDLARSAMKQVAFFTHQATCPGASAL